MSYSKAVRALTAQSGWPPTTKFVYAAFLAADTGSDVVDVAPVGFVGPFFVGQQGTAEHHHVGGAVPQYLFGGVGVVQFTDFHNGDGQSSVGEYAVASECFFDVAGDGGEAGWWHGVGHVGEPPVVVAAQVHIKHVDAGLHQVLHVVEGLFYGAAVDVLFHVRLEHGLPVCFVEGMGEVDAVHDGVLGANPAPNFLDEIQPEALWIAVAAEFAAVPGTTGELVQ